MADHRITDFVDPQAIASLKNLKDEIDSVKASYIEASKELIKGLNMNVNGLEDLEKMNKLLQENQRKAAESTEKLTRAVTEQSAAYSRTTAQMAESLQEQNKLDRQVRQSKVDHEQVRSVLEKVNGTYDQRLKRLIEVQQEMSKNSAALKELERDYNKGLISTDRYQQSVFALTKTQRELAQEKTTLSSRLKNEEKEMNSVQGSYNHLSQELELLKKAYKDLTEEEKKDQFGKDMLATINQLDTELKHQAEEMGEHQRNVGDYAIANASIKKDLKDLVLEIATLTIQYRALSEEEQNSAEGQELSEHIRELTERAGVLRDTIGDTNAAIANAASDTRGFDQLSGALQLSIDGFGLLTGATEMLGLSSEDLAEIQTKLQAAIAASNAMQSIQNTLQSQSAVMQGVNLVQTRLRTVAENLHTAAQGKGVIATYALTAAQWAFNAAANANPIGLLIVGITAAIGAVYGLVKAFKAFFGVSEEALENYDKQKKALDDMCEANDKLIARMKARGATEAELLEQSLLNKQREKEAADALFERAKELYDEDEDAYKEALDAKKKADEDYEQQKEDSLNYLLKVIHASEEEEKKERLGTYEYKRQLIQAELEQQKAIAATLLAQEKITRQVYENLCASLDKAAQLKIERVNKEETEANDRKKPARSSSSNDPKKAVEDLKKQVEAGEDALLNLISDSLERQRQAEILSYKRRLTELQKSLSEEMSKRKQNAKLINALQNQIEGLEAAHQKKLADLELSRLERVGRAEAEFISSHLDAVEKGTAEEYEWKMKSLKNQMSAEYREIYKLEQEKTLTVEQANEMRANITLKYARLETDLVEEYAELRIKAIQDESAAETVIAENAYNRQLALLKKKLAEDLEAAGTNEQKRAQIQMQYEEEVAKLTEHYAQQTAHTQIAMIEEMLDVEDLSAEERARLEAELAKAKIELEDAIADAAIAANKRMVDADTEAAKKRIANAQQWLQVSSDGLNAINDLASAVFDAKIQKIEEEEDASTKASERETQMITELVEKKVITQEEGEARKRAAEATSAKKTEELERKKQQLQYKQALWNKANSIAQAAIATALAITQALPNVVLAAIAGAMGAVQLATIIATPIPKYAKGTDYHPGGLAIVGDAGKKEVVLIGSDMYLTPDTPTIIDMPKGAQVYPDLGDFLAGQNDMTPVKSSDMPNVIVNNDFARLEKKMAESNDILRMFMKQQHREAYYAKYDEYKRSML